MLCESNDVRPYHMIVYTIWYWYHIMCTIIWYCTIWYRFALLSMHAMSISSMHVSWVKSRFNLWQSLRCYMATTRVNEVEKPTLSGPEKQPQETTTLGESLIIVCQLILRAPVLVCWPPSSAGFQGWAYARRFVPATGLRRAVVLHE